MPKLPMLTWTIYSNTYLRCQASPARRKPSPAGLSIGVIDWVTSHVGRPHPDIMPDLCTIPFESVVIAYLAGAKRVEVIRIFHAAQDYETLLRNP